MSDILQEAEALIEKHSTSGYIHRDATLLLPGLVEEIKHLRVLECAAKANMTRRDEDIGDLMKELAKWQQIAIEERCKAIMLIEKLQDVTNNPDWQTRGLSKTYEEYMEQAAKELGLQYTFKTAYGTDGPIEINGERYVRESEQKAYIDRLEAAYLDMWRISLSDKDGNLTPDQLKELDEAANTMLQLQAQAALEKIRRG